ncbi:MAG: hypothetical protein MI919_10970, partial [Holophagales bacterium]|nr:hypothetical protein [Holophagales bacterium]
AAGVLQLRTSHVMWQKERLLNHAIENLPPEYDKVAWLDCDLIFDNPFWPAQADSALDRFAAVQLFERVTREAPPGIEETETEHGVVWGLAHGRRLDQPVPVHGSPGFAWAARREILEECGLYDKLILGAADYAMVHTMYGTYLEDYSFPKRIVSEKEFALFLPWAERFHRRVAGKVGWVPGRIRHLWHGRQADRRYGTRLIDMRPYDFDPAVDIRIGNDQCWQWATDKPGLHDYVARYFAERREDG